MSSARSELEAGLNLLEGLAKRGEAPSHYVARQVLLALGRALEERELSESDALVERARALGTQAGAAWEDAIAAELSFACGEFAQCVDPRYLRLPNYDMEYTRSARARLSDRMVAAGLLGYSLTERELEVLALADQVLEQHSRARKAGG
jgi:hypothetical protein